MTAGTVVCEDEVVVSFADEAHIAISGQIDIATAGAVASACRRSVETAAVPRLDVNLHALEFCDASGLAVFVQVAAELRARGGSLRLLDVPDGTAKIIRISGLQDLLG